MRVFERGPSRIEIDLVDHAVVVREFRAGALVDERQEEASSAIKAKWDADRLGRRYLAQGYTRVGDEIAAPSQTELVAALEATPDDLDTYLVFSDWLLERGDPWGQLIAVQHAMATLPRFGSMERRDELDREEMKLLFQHGARLWGTLGETIVDEGTQTYASGHLRPEWRCGFVRSVSTDDAGARHLAKLARLEIARLLRQITLGCADWGDDVLGPLFSETWPQLEVVTFDSVYDALIDAGTLVPILDGKIAPRLAELKVYRSRSTDELCHALAASPLARQLRRIVLQVGQFTDAGIAALAATSFDALDRLSLTGIGPPGAATTLRAKAKSLHVDLREPGGYDDDY